MPFRIVQVGHPTVRPARRRSQELGPTAAQLVVRDPEVLHANHKETLGRSTALPWRATVDREPDRPPVEMDDVALVEEKREAEEVSVEPPRSVQIFRIQDNPLDRERHDHSPPASERRRPL